MSWAADLFRRKTLERAQPDPIPQHSAHSQFGPGLGTQPQAELLLHESKGIAATATRAIVNRLASLELEVYTEGRDGSEDELVTSHPLSDLLRKPNPTFSRRQLIALVGNHLITVGEGYWLKVGDRMGITRELHPLHPGKVTPILSGGIVAGYTILDGDGGSFEIPSEDVVRVWMPDPESLYSAEGYLAPNGTLTDAGSFAGQHLRSHFENDATPPAVITADKDASAPGPDDRERFEAKWVDAYHRRVGSKRGLPAWLPSGFSITQLAAMNGGDLESLLRYLDDQQLLNFGVARSVLGQVVSGDRSSAETNQFVFDQHTVLPLATMIGDALTDQLASDFDSDLRIRFKEFVMRDKAFLLQQETADLTSKVRTINEVRGKRTDLDATTWGDLPVGSVADMPYTGDEPFELEHPDALGGTPAPQPVALVPEPGEEEEPAERTRGHNDPAAFSPAVVEARLMRTERKFRRRLELAMRSAFRAQMIDTVRRFRDLNPSSRAIEDDILSLALWDSLIREKVAPLYELVFRETGTQTITALLPEAEFVFGTEVVAQLDRHAADLIKGTSNTTKVAIRNALARGTEAGEGVNQLAKRITEVFNTRRRHAKVIARTEVLKANQAAQLEAFSQSGVVERKSWNTSQDDLVRDAHKIDGKVVNMGADFILADGQRASAPGDPRLPARDVINCRCFVLPVITPGA